MSLDMCRVRGWQNVFDDKKIVFIFRAPHLGTGVFGEYLAHLDPPTTCSFHGPNDPAARAAKPAAAAVSCAARAPDTPPAEALKPSRYNS